MLEGKTMNFSKTEAAIEAILFSMGEAVPTRKIAEALELSVDDVYQVLLNMKDKYDDHERGVMLLEIDESFQMCTKREYYEQVKKINFKLKEFILTDVLIETLSIVAYKQPVTRAQIEAIRGVNSNHAVNKLIEYNLVSEVGRLEVPGRPILFGTTKDFLRGFGLQSVKELPELGAEALSHLKEEVEQEMQLALPQEGLLGDDQPIQFEEEPVENKWTNLDEKMNEVDGIEEDQEEQEEQEEEQNRVIDLDNLVLTIDES
jgi:segregation and condensation protein B